MFYTCILINHHIKGFSITEFSHELGMVSGQLLTKKIVTHKLGLGLGLVLRLVGNIPREQLS